MKRIFIVLLAVLSAFASSACRTGNVEQPPTETLETTAATTKEPTAAEEPTDEVDFGLLEVYVFGIGKADAILLITKNHTVMIDAGERKHGQFILDELEKRGIYGIDCLIVTHFHKDHVGGAAAVIENVAVKEVVVPNYGKDSAHYGRFAAAMSEAGLLASVLTETQSFDFDGVEFTLYPAWQGFYHYGGGEDDDEYEDEGEDGDMAPEENNFSIAVGVTHGENSFLFAGDAKAKRLKELLSDTKAMTWDYLKIPNHGRHNRRSAEFIYAASPRYAVITTSPDNPADGRVVSALEGIGAEIYMADKSGVYCISDGKSLDVGYTPW